MTPEITLLNFSNGHVKIRDTHGVTTMSTPEAEAYVMGLPMPQEIVLRRSGDSNKHVTTAGKLQQADCGWWGWSA